jgi:hydroxymethylpyrimidine/phosphomethylpyrimidine kinase
VSAPARVLVIAGHDPTGGAGVAADREACAHFGVEVSAVVTAWTEQDGERVQAVRPRPSAEWGREARAALEPVPAAVKTGLLSNAADVRELVALLAPLSRDVPVVVDPVLAASGGEPFLDSDGLEWMRAELFRRGVILTPNLPELARLSGARLAALENSPAARVVAAEALLARGLSAVVVKGGHAPDLDSSDVLLRPGKPPVFVTHPRLADRRLHGSGCRFASALAANLALGKSLPDALRAASGYLHALLERKARDG